MRSTGIARQLISEVHVLPAFDPAKPPDPLPPSIKTTALWDTGATRSVLSSDLAQRLALPIVGTTKVSHAGGVGASPTYLVNFILPNKVVVAGVIVTEFPAFSGSFEAIIGMDIITQGDFSLTHMAGRSCMSFRIPSCEEIDYVAAANRINFAGVGRNDPCPCGKRRADGGPVKFKHCHGA
jgi:hypothetical protein